MFAAERAGAIMPILRRALAAVLAASLTTAAWAQAGSDPAAAPEAVESRPAAATVARATVAEVVARVPVSGTLVAQQEIQVFPQVSGYEIVEIAVDAGDRVEKGALLARLSDLTLNAQLQQAEAEYMRAEAALRQARSQVASTEAALNQAAAALERAQALRRSGSASQAALDQAISAEASARAAAASAADGVAVAQAALAQAAAARDIARLNVERTRIVAPEAGVISARTAELGAIAGTGQAPLFTLVAGGRIELAGEIIETALGDLKMGDPATVRVAGVGEVEGTVRLVPAAVDPVTRLGVVRISLGDDPALRTGLFATGWIITERRQAVTVPASAVLTAAGHETVQVVRNGRIETREVEAGLLWEDLREIRAGLEAGETVVARAGAFFRDGDPIDAVEPAAPAGEPGGTAAPAPAADGSAAEAAAPTGAAQAAQVQR